MVIEAALVLLVLFVATGIGTVFVYYVIMMISDSFHLYWKKREDSVNDKVQEKFCHLRPDSIEETKQMIDDMNKYARDISYPKPSPVKYVYNLYVHTYWLERKLEDLTDELNFLKEEINEKDDSKVD